jgi:hypothetical protein
VVWKMAPICLFWCLWRERNNKSFEDLESTLEEITYSSYLCTFGLRLMSTICLLLADFLARFSLFTWVFPCILSVYQGVPYAFLMRLVSYLSKKKVG